MQNIRSITLSVALLGLLPASQVHAQINTLTNFSSSTGAKPYSGVTASLDGTTLYGTTDGSGATLATVYSLPVTGGTPTTLATFDTTPGVPSADLLLSGDTLYGTTTATSVGKTNDGVVFSVPVTGGTPTTLATLPYTPGTELAGANSGLILSGGTLYGETFDGGANTEGRVYSLPLTGGTPTTVTSFYTTNGENPQGGLTLSGNTLYGTTVIGGIFSGTVFSVSASGVNAPHATLASFPAVGPGYPPTVTDGYPTSGVTLVGNTLYGTASGSGVGSTNDGTIFAVPTSGNNVLPTPLLTFTGPNGSTPNARLTLNGTTLYGTTKYGGAYNDGTVFAFDLTTNTLTTLASFDGTNGANPMSDLLLINGTLYGTTMNGGANGDGTVFSVNLEAAPEPASWALGVIALGTAVYLRRRVLRA